MGEAVIWHPSPNFGDRRDGATPELIVLHYTAMETAEAARDWLCNPASEVSAHYLIAADGHIWQMVDERARAWHAGAGEWQGRGDVNSRSIGIELDNRGTHPFAAPLMDALDRLLQQIMTRWAIPAEGVIGHSDMAPGRKIDPGPRFDWARLAAAGLARETPTPDGMSQVPDTAAFRDLAARLGYTASASEEALLKAVRDRHATTHQGPLSKADLAVVLGLLKA
ncbi:MAG: N-acetylmuramoyl-L-alanine amidase [Rhodobacteraceae bacterium]|nr:N-acetylmuramoyl-L-alanine amidase [Paracoccaceae bacterium]